MPSPYAVVYASDERGVVPLGVAIHSLFKHASDQTVYAVCILSGGISAESQRKLGGLASGAHGRHGITFIETSTLPQMRDLPVREGKWPSAAWARIFIPELLPDQHGVILYCDIDTLVCRDLGELFRTPLDGKAIGVVLEHLSHQGSHFNERLGMPADCPGYFNSGVMLMDLDVFRRQNLIGRIVRYVDEYREALYCYDQDALNGALHDHLQPIHPRWNWHDGLTRLLLVRSGKAELHRGVALQDAVDAALRPGILHYQGKNKPWRYNHRIEGRRYEEALRESGFGEYPLPGKTWMKSLKRKMNAVVYWLTWAKIRRLDRHLRRAPARGREFGHA